MRDSRERGKRRYEPYSRGGRRSRSPVGELNYDDPPRNTGIELFPQKVSTKSGIDRDEAGPSRSRSRSRSPPRRRIVNNHPVFNDMRQTVFSADHPRRPRGQGARMELDDDYTNDNDLFPSKGDNTTKRAAMDSVPALGERISSRNGTAQRTSAVELFPEKISRTGTVELFPQKTTGTMMSGKSLLERIQDDEGGRRELFPEKVGGAGRRNRRKAEDHF